MSNIFLFGICVVLMSSPVLAEKYCGKLTRARGTVEILRLVPTQEGASPVRNAIIARRKMMLLCTDIVVTRKSSRAKIKMKKASLSLGSNSRIALSKYAETSKEASVLELTYGRVRAFLKKKKKDPGTGSKKRSKKKIRCSNSLQN